MNNKQKTAILSKNPNKKTKKELNNQARINNFNGFLIGSGVHKDKKHKIRQKEKLELRQIIDAMEL